MNSVFSEQILADKLSKLNSTQQCIETLSHWCIFHRSKADLVVATWDREFHKLEMVRKVPLLYLANDILQNSKRKGNEFVSEFWKVLPAALKVVIENGDERGKTVVSRLVNIWEERKVFGSSVGNLKDVMLGEDAAPPLELGKKRSRSVKIVKRDSRSIRTKLSIGGTAEKIVSAFHLVDSEHTNEDVEKSNCKSAIHRVRRMEKDVDVACISNEKDPKRETLAKELEEEENTLRQCIEKLKSVEASRLALVSQLKDALHEQESELENVRTQMQVAQVRADEANIMQKRLKNEDYVPLASTGAAQTDKRTAASIAAEVAEKLAASTSSQMIMHSVLSTFAAEEAKSAGLAKSSATVSESVPKAGERVQVSDHNAFIPPAQPFTVSNPSYQSGIPPQPSVQNQVPSSQGQYHALPNPQSQQYMQPSGGIMSSYGYGSITPLPPGPPPPPPYMVSPMVPLTQPQPPSHIAQQQQGPLGQQPVQRQPQGPGFQPLQPPGMAYYGHPPRS